jgi:hypothetical protein
VFIWGSYDRLSLCNFFLMMWVRCLVRICSLKIAQKYTSPFRLKIKFYILERQAKYERCRETCNNNLTIMNKLFLIYSTEIAMNVQMYITALSKEIILYRTGNFTFIWKHFEWYVRKSTHYTFFLCIFHKYFLSCLYANRYFLPL